MATANGQKALCSLCEKATGILTCHGCGKYFCYHHVTEHRQELNKQMDEITANRDQLQQAIVEQVEQPSCHPLMKRIDVWEQQSIDTIHQAADNARRELLIALKTHRTHVVNDLEKLTTELNKARNENNYIETDMKEWMEKLNKLELDLTASHIVNFDQNNNETILIPKIFINDASTDIFHQIVGDVQISECGRIMTHGPLKEIAAARCRNQYSLEQHRFRFKIEKLSSNNGFSCGILSNSTPTNSIFITSANYTMYGYVRSSFRTHTCLDHHCVFTFNKQNHEFQINDVYELLIDCDRQMMRLTNERLGIIQELNINLTKYPFPWQLLITLLQPDDRVCLC